MDFKEIKGPADRSLSLAQPASWSRNNMIMQPTILILDCGATNVKACLVDTAGKTIASHSLPNETIPDPFHAGGLIWDMDDIWNKLAICSQHACAAAGNAGIIAVTVTTFGVDGAAVKKDGTLCYPVISWQCGRTEAVERNISRYFDREWLYQKTGLQSYHFNTIHKLIWLRENRPDVLDEMDYYVLMPSLILQRLSGEFVTDTTMAGTSMLTDLRKRAFDEEILKPLGMSPSCFPVLTEPGSVVGKVTAKAAEALGIKAGIAVIAAGHDTQFAILASGAGINQPVLSSGTWEILMVRAQAEALQVPVRESGVTIELDARQGLVNPGVQWVASGVMEWIGRLFYPDMAGDSARYKTMIREASDIPAGCQGVALIPELYPGGFSGKPGTLSGFTHETTRAHVYRAGLEALSCYLAHGLEKLQQVGNYTAQDMICVGGGSKNQLWNQIRADVLGIPLKALDMKETTALGASLVAMAGMGIYKNVEEAFNAIESRYEVYTPGENRERYSEVYGKFVERVFQ
jgi:L-fuculokinase